MSDEKLFKWLEDLDRRGYVVHNLLYVRSDGSGYSDSLGHFTKEDRLTNNDLEGLSNGIFDKGDT